MKIVWDEPKRTVTLATRGLDFATLTPEFFMASVVTGTRAGRFKAIGATGGATLTVIFKPLGREAIAIISMRPASRKERTLYEQTPPG